MIKQVSYPPSLISSFLTIVTKSLLEEEEDLKKNQDQLYLLLEKCIKALELKTIGDPLKFTVEALLKIYKDLFTTTPELPKFLIELYMRYNPLELVLIYLNHGLVQVIIINLLPYLVIFCESRVQYGLQRESSSRISSI